MQAQADAELAPLWQRVYRDMHLGNDLFESFVNYQACLLAQFDALASVYHFQILDASQPVEVLLDDLKQQSRRYCHKGSYFSSHVFASSTT